MSYSSYFAGISQLFELVEIKKLYMRLPGT